jgi:hypothetical protein
LLAKAVYQAMEMLSVPTPSRASFAPTDILSNPKARVRPKSNVGASLLAKALCQAMKMLTVLTPSRASPVPTGISAALKIPITPQIKCGSEPARESSVSGNEDVDCADALAGKPGSHRNLGRTQNPDHTPN